MPKQDGILRQEARLSTSSISHAQNDMVFKIRTNTRHPEDEVRRISKENALGILRFAQNDKKCAFTLAEVLITLGIIGIVAAMTLPALINKSQQMILKNQFKKTYSTLTQALLKAQVDYGSVPACHYDLDRSVIPPRINSTKNAHTVIVECTGFKSILLKSLNVVQTCEDNAYPKRCIPKYKGFDTMAVEQNPDLSEEEALDIVKSQPGFHEQDILYKNTVYILADGVIIVDYNASPSFPMIFAVDVNGKKGPNKWGYDLFAFFTAADNKSDLVLIGTDYLVEKGGKTTRQMIKDLYNDKK